MKVTILPFQMVELALLRESPLNKRQHGDAEKLAELADNIRSRGIITPLLVRPIGNGAFEIAAGHRRFRAARIAGLAEAPCIVREMSDEDFLEILTIENLQREDLHPLDEAEAFAELMKRPGYDAACVAAKAGKTALYITRRLQLLQLTGPAREAFLRNDIPIGHAIMLAQLPEKLQEKGLEECWDRYWDRYFMAGGKHSLVTAHELRRALNKLTKAVDLAKAPFPLDMVLATEKQGDALSCVACPKAPGCNPLLIDDLNAKTCLDGGCYERKVQSWIQIKATDGLVKVSNDYYVSGEDLPVDVLPANSYDTIYDPDDKDRTADPDGAADLEDENCEFSEEAVVAKGYGAGRVIRICRSEQCPKHGLRNTRSIAIAERLTKAHEKDEREGKRQKLQLKARVQARETALALILESDWKDAIDVSLGRWVLQGLLMRTDCADDRLVRIAGRVGMHLDAKKTPKGKKLLDVFFDQAAELDGQGRARLVISALLDYEVGTWYDDGQNDRLAVATTECGYDLKEIEATALAALKKGASESAAKAAGGPAGAPVKPPAAKVPAKTKKRAAAPAKAAGKASSVAHRLHPKKAAKKAMSN